MLSKVGERLTVGAGEVETGTTTFGAEFAMETGTTTFGAEFEIGGEFATTFCATGIAQAEAADPIYIYPNEIMPQSKSII